MRINPETLFLNKKKKKKLIISKLIVRNKILNEN